MFHLFPSLSLNNSSRKCTNTSREISIITLNIKIWCGGPPSHESHFSYLTCLLSFTWCFHDSLLPFPPTKHGRTNIKNSRKKVFQFFISQIQIAFTSWCVLFKWCGLVCCWQTIFYQLGSRNHYRDYLVRQTSYKSAEGCMKMIYVHFIM